MQADRFTIKSQEAIAAAQKLAGARRNPEVSPHHLLAALLEQRGGAEGGAGIVVPVLRRANADPETVRRRANAALDALPTVTGDSAAAPARGEERSRNAVPASTAPSISSALISLLQAA